MSLETPGKGSRALAGGGIASVLSLTALATLTACSGPAGSGGTTVDVGLSSHSQPVATAPPGKYQSLPEPCGAVDSGTLHTLLPSSPDYAGDATATYDTDRRAGCRWSGSLSGGDRFLSVDLERVVSYDPSVSDNDRAARDFQSMAQAAHVPLISPASSASPSSSGSPSGSPSPSSSGSPSPSAPASAGPGDSLSPRRIGGIGDEAYLDDDLVTEGADVHRDVTVVFRTANVLVTIVFSQWSTGTPAAPPSADLQLGADRVAQELAGQFD